MAQYEYKYACGHGTGIVNLYGKNSERERKLAWYEQTHVCPECYKKQQEAKDAAAEKTAVIKYRIGELPYFSVVLNGQTKENKDKIKAAGFVWEEDSEEGMLGMLSMKQPPKAWQKTFSARSETEYRQKVAQIIAEAAALGYELKGTANHVIDMGLLAHQWAKIAEADKAAAETKAKAEADKPAYNGCFEFLKEKHGDDYNKRERAGGQPWNGKIYGKSGYYNYYIDNKRYSMTDEQAAAIREYQEAIKAWREKHR